MYFRAVIESVLSFSITVWFGRASQDEINQIESVVKNASKLIGLNMPSIIYLYLSRSLRKCKRIVQDAYHPANHPFELLPSGKRYRCIKLKRRDSTIFLSSSAEMFKRRAIINVLPLAGRCNVGFFYLLYNSRLFQLFLVLRLVICNV